MTRPLAAALTCALLFRLAHAQAPPPAVPPSPDEPALVVYLRAQTPLIGENQAVCELAEAALARLPGLRARFFVEPDDRSTSLVADALGGLPDDRSRCALIRLLGQRAGAGRNVDADAIDRALRALGRGVTPRGDSPRRFRSYATAPLTREGQAIARRPIGVEGPRSPYTALDGTVLSPERLWVLLDAHAPLAGQRPFLARTGSGIAVHLVAVRFPSYRTNDLGRACALLEVARALDEMGRITLELSVDDGPGDPPPDPLLSRALRAAEPRVALALARTLCGKPWPHTAPETIALLDAAGLRPGQLARVPGPGPSRPREPEVPELYLDGAPAMSYELGRLWELPSLKARLLRPRRLAPTSP